MENKDWLNDYMSLKQVNPVNPFTVPAGYFDELADHIISLKNLDELKNSGLSGGFTVPENYFEELTANIQSRIAVENALNREDTGFIVPAGYFDNLGQQISSRILVEEALSNPAEHFTVPPGYFNQLRENILNKTANASGGNRNAIVRRLFASTAFKYATAACFALVLGGGILLNELANSPVNEHNNSFLHKQLSKIPVDEIKSYLQLNVDAGDTQQTVTTEGSPVNENSLKDALQNYADSVQ
ncbi:MAG TPA: hypothetical protein VIM16_12455 [Mucilaginibacter sp.]